MIPADWIGAQSLSLLSLFGCYGGMNYSASVVELVYTPRARVDELVQSMESI
jgi:hypothetical protein